MTLRTANLRAMRVRDLLRMNTGQVTEAPLAAKVSRQWYALDDNSRGLKAIALDFTSRSPAILVRTAAGEMRTPFGIGTWQRSGTGFTNGLDRLLAVPRQPAVALNGAWTADSVFTLKIVAPETPYYTTMTFSFGGDTVTVDSEHNVAFGPTKLARLTGRASGRLAEN